jgi:hypothetical protein
VAEATISISIKERIERVIAATLAAQFPQSRVEPWAERNSFDNAGLDGDILIVPGDESIAEVEGNIGYADKILPVQIHLLVMIPESFTPAQARTHNNRRLAALEKAIMTNRYMLETQSEGAPIQLAIKTLVTGTLGPIVEDGSPSGAVGVEIDVYYMHDADNPGKFGVAIPEKFE